MAEIACVLLKYGSMAKTRVAFFSDILVENFDGANRTMFQIIRRIPRDEFEFLFFCGYGADNNKILGLDVHKVPALSVPLNNDYRIAIPQFAKDSIIARLDSFAPDVIHIATPSLLGIFAMRYARQRHIPVISIYHTHFTSYIDYYFSALPLLVPAIKNKALHIQRSFYNRCDKVYVPSESIIKELSKTGIDENRMKLWKRGINTSLFTPGKRNRSFIKNITGNNKPCILFASRLVWEKNLKTLIKIYEICQQKKLPFNFIIAGDGTARHALQRRMKTAFFLGKLNHQELSTLYASSDVFLFPSVSETCGNVVLEAMASGLPCVIADGGGSRDFIQQGKNGFLANPFHAEDYINKIELLTTYPLLRNHIAEQALMHSYGSDWNTLVNQYLLDIRQLAGTINTESANDSENIYEQKLAS